MLIAVLDLLIRRDKIFLKRPTPQTPKPSDPRSNDLLHLSLLYRVILDPFRKVEPRRPHPHATGHLVCQRGVTVIRHHAPLLALLQRDFALMLAADRWWIFPQRTSNLGGNVVASEGSPLL